MVNITRASVRCGEFQVRHLFGNCLIIWTKTRLHWCFNVVEFRYELQKWAFLVSLVSAASIVPLASVFGAYLHIVAAALGLPLGIGLLHTVQ